MADRSIPVQSDDQPALGDLYPAFDTYHFRQRYPPNVLRPRAQRTERVARALRQRLGYRSILGVAFYPWHDQSALWWFEQGILTLLAATGWQTVWVTDARYKFDDERFAELGGRISIVRHPGSDIDWKPPDGKFDAVISLFPCDLATRAANILGARLIAFAVKNIHADEPPLTERPPDGTPLWHAFAGSRTFLHGAYGPLGGGMDKGRLGKTADAWRLAGRLFPINLYYVPLRAARPVFDALIFGSKARDYDTAFAALARAGAGRIAALANVEDADQVRSSAHRHGVDALVQEQMSHLDLLDLLAQTRLIINPIRPPDEGHYTMSLPLAVGRPIVATDAPSTHPYAGPGVSLAAQGDVAAWAECIAKFLSETKDALPYRPALQQGVERHDLDRFFASAILATMRGDFDTGRKPDPQGEGVGG